MQTERRDQLGIESPLVAWSPSRDTVTAGPGAAVGVPGRTGNHREAAGRLARPTDGVDA